LWGQSQGAFILLNHYGGTGMKTQFSQQQTDRYYQEMAKEEAARNKVSKHKLKKLSEALKRFRPKASSDD
jgi:hypothetical protein